MPEVALDRPCILAVIGKLVTGAVTQHVAVNEKREFGSLAGPGNHTLITSHAEWRPAFTDNTYTDLNGASR